MGIRGPRPASRSFQSLQKPEGFWRMDHLVRQITWINDSEKPSSELQERYSKLGFSDVTVSEETLDDWFCLLYKVQGAKALPAIQSGDLKHLSEDTDFLEDGLMCEWAYFIDFEKMTLETWCSSKLLGKVTFEELEEEGEEYMDGIQRGTGYY